MKLKKVLEYFKKLFSENNESELVFEPINYDELSIEQLEELLNSIKEQKKQHIYNLQLFHNPNEFDLISLVCALYDYRISIIENKITEKRNNHKLSLTNKN